MSNKPKKEESFVVKIHNIVNGIIRAVEHEFKNIEDAMAHIGQNQGHGYKVYNHKGELTHSQNAKHHKKEHEHSHNDDHDTYA